MNNLLISSGINKKSSKVNWRTPQLVIAPTKTGFYCCFVLLFLEFGVVCVLIASHSGDLRVMLSAWWCPVARVGLVEGVFGEEVAVIFLNFAWAERGLLGKSSAFLVIQFTLLLDFRRWPFLISAHIATALINSSNWLSLVDRSRFLRHWRFAA